MSSYLAIGGVSLTLKALLDDRMVLTDPGLAANELVTVTVSAPNVVHGNVTGPRVNLFLLNVTENAYLKNQEIPGQGHPAAYGNPPLSLDLHYLLTAFGTAPETDVSAQRALGDAMRVFHDFAILPDGLMRARNAGVPVLDNSLLGEFERVKICLAPMSVEETSKIWSSLPESHFRCSVAYQVSLVQIESRRQRGATLPVLRQRVVAYPFSNPQLSEVFRDPPLGGTPVPIAQVGENLRIRGANLAGRKRATLAGVDMPLVSQRADELVATVPPGIPAGVHPLQVAEEIVLGVEPGQPLRTHRSARSNAVAVMVIPRITGFNPATAASGSPLEITLDPPVEADQQIEVWVGDRILEAQLVPATVASSATVGTTLALDPDTYLIRVRVDGAESRLTTDPATGVYSGPTYVVT